LSEELKAFRDLKPKSGSDEITAMTELGHPDAPPSYVLFGGDHEKPLEEVKPAFPEAITDEKPDISRLRSLQVDVQPWQNGLPVRATR